jgi:NAD binding domain of 6-phosphogluconate dehydrogenase
MTVRIALLGLGEAGSEIAADLVAAGADVRGYDPKVAAPPGVAGRVDEADAVRDADLVLSANSSHDAVPALINALPGLRTGTLWADLNTAAPQVKEQLVEVLAGRDVPVVDVALMSPVPGRGIRTPMLVSGEGADRYAGILGSLGAAVTVQPGPPARRSRASSCAASSTRVWRPRSSRPSQPRRPRGARTGCATTSAPSWRASTSTPSTGSSTARTGTPGAEPTRWPPPPSS